MTTSQKGNIFISYRRADTMFAAGRIYDRLSAHFGEEAIFMDVEAIDGGVDFVEVLEDAVQSCEVVLVLIGKQWLTIRDVQGKRRLDNPEDFVRIEVATALKRKIRVIPVLVEFAEMPHSTELPENLKRLARRNALPANHRSFHADANRIIEHVKRALKAVESAKTAQGKQVRFAKAKDEAEEQARIEERARQLALEMAEKEREEEARDKEEDEKEHVSDLKVKIAQHVTEVLNRSRQDEDAANPAGIEWIKIPAGEFIMGSNDIDDAKPERKVHLPEYQIAKTPVTNTQFKKFIDAGGYKNKAFWSATGWGWRESNKRTQPRHWTDSKLNRSQQPVVGVSWYEAEAFCNWANCRLPSEAEWEKAARGTDGRKYPWGNAPPSEEKANFKRNIRRTTFVGKYSPAGDSPYGCVDMAGNVREWCADWYDVYLGGELNVFRDSDNNHVVNRGGSWNSKGDLLRSAIRYKFHPSKAHPFLGFRCSR